MSAAYDALCAATGVRHDPCVLFSYTPSSALVRLVIKLLNITFVTPDRSLVRYEGRVPPMQKVGGKLKDLDARVEYRTVAA